MDRQPVFIDTCALADKAIETAYRMGLIEGGEVVVLRSVSDEIQRLRLHSDPAKRAVGHQAMETLLQLHRLPTVELVMDHRAPMAESTDLDLLMRAQESNGKLLTADRELQQKAKAAGVVIISVQERQAQLRLFAAELIHLFPPPRKIKMGEFLTVCIDKPGEKVGQGVGFLQDGRMVVIDEGKQYLGQELAVKVRGIIQTAAGREMIFASHAA